MTAVARSQDYDSPSLWGLEPPTQLAEHLLPPLKREGVWFEEAWPVALSRIDWRGFSERDQKDWLVQLGKTSAGWQAAYQDEPATSAEEQVGSLMGVFDVLRELSEAS